MPFLVVHRVEYLLHETESREKKSQPRENILQISDRVEHRPNIMSYPRISHLDVIDKIRLVILQIYITQFLHVRFKLVTVIKEIKVAK